MKDLNCCVCKSYIAMESIYCPYCGASEADMKFMSGKNLMVNVTAVPMEFTLRMGAVPSSGEGISILLPSKFPLIYETFKEEKMYNPYEIAGMHFINAKGDCEFMFCISMNTQNRYSRDQVYTHIRLQFEKEKVGMDFIVPRNGNHEYWQVNYSFNRFDYEDVYKLIRMCFQEEILMMPMFIKNGVIYCMGDYLPVRYTDENKDAVFSYILTN